MSEVTHLILKGLIISNSMLNLDTLDFYHGSKAKMVGV